MTEPEALDDEPDIVDIFASELGSEDRARALLKRLNDRHYAVVNVGREAIEQAVMAVAGILEGVPPHVFLAALADQGVWIIGRPKMRHDMISLADNTLLMTHPAERCQGRNCCIHNPSDHALKAAPMHWNDAARRTERVCPHGQHHPDPDHLTYVLDHEGMLAYFEHKYHSPCDGCCNLPNALLNVR